jgi:hypothetical protein
MSLSEETLEMLNGLSEIEVEILAPSEGWTMCSQLNRHLLMEATRYVLKNQIPGDIVECGVWRGGMMQIVARTVLSEQSIDPKIKMRQLWLFDTFEGMPDPTHELDRDMYRGEHASEKLKREPKSGPNGEPTVWCVADLGDVKADQEANTVSVPAPGGVATLTDVFRRVDQLGLELADISLRKPTLDEVFFHLTEKIIT